MLILVTIALVAAVLDPLLGRTISRMPFGKSLTTFASLWLVASFFGFLAVQSVPVLGWILWAVAVTAAGAGASLWFKGEFASAQQAEEEVRAATQRKESDRGKAELRRQRGLRRAELMTKYAGDQALVERIVLGAYWERQTAAQLRDALGNPADIAAKILKGKRQEVWKYHPTGGDRYALWIMLEQDRVLRWEERA